MLSVASLSIQSNSVPLFKRKKKNLRATQLVRYTYIWNALPDVGMAHSALRLGVKSWCLIPLKSEMGNTVFCMQDTLSCSILLREFCNGVFAWIRKVWASLKTRCFLLWPPRIEIAVRSFPPNLPLPAKLCHELFQNLFFFFSPSEVFHVNILNWPTKFWPWLSLFCKVLL